MTRAMQKQGSGWRVNNRNLNYQNSQIHQPIADAIMRSAGNSAPQEYIMKKSLLLEAIGSNLEEVKATMEVALQLSFTAHESEHHGGEFFRADVDGVEDPADRISTLIEESTKFLRTNTY
jgi:uncharacterized protein YhdP